MAAGDAALAWAYLNRSPEYRTAWTVSAQAPAYVAGPIPLRMQSDGDLEAARFALLAWEDPVRTEGVTSPFWAEAPMLVGELVQPPGPMSGNSAGSRPCCFSRSWRTTAKPLRQPQFRAMRNCPCG